MRDEKAVIFEQHRRTLEGIAYRMLGTLTEARDVVQETYLKWHEVNLDALVTPRAWLITVCTRIALNLLKTVRKQREIYVGEWLPEPFPDEPDNDPSLQAEINDSISFALLVALEKLSPLERAVFLLHDIFDLTFEEISSIVGKSSANCRQLATRARKHVRADRSRFQATAEEHRMLLEGFMLAARQLDAGKLVSLLAEGVEFYSDGGGKVEALPEVLRGARDIASFFVAVFARYHQHGTMIQTRLQQFNGSLGIFIYENGVLATTMTIEADSDKIRHIYAVRNPDKLHGLLLANSKR